MVITMKIIRKLLLIICILCAIGAAIIMYPMHTAIPGIATPYILDVIAIARNTYDEMYRQKLLDAYRLLPDASLEWRAGEGHGPIS